MKDLYTYLDKAKAICDEVGIKYGTIDEIVPNSRAKSRWGQCRRLSNGHFSININSVLLEDSVSEEAILNTVVHELLHAAPNGWHHQSGWEMYAEKVNKAHPELCIKRSTSCEEKNVTVIKTTKIKYVVHCRGCSMTWNYYRLGKVLKNIEFCSCPRCHNKLYIEYK